MDTLHSRVVAALERRGHAPAVVAGGAVLSARALLDRSAEMAAGLGVRAGDVVAFEVDRSAQSIVTMVALLRSGCAYLPLDPALPEPWREHLITLAGARLLTDSGLVPGPTRPADGLAYVMGTSGTTGLPKAVPISQAGLLHYCDAFAERVGALEGAHLASVTTLAADLGNTMVFPALLFGAVLHLVPDETARDPRQFGTYLRTHRIDALKVVPSHLRALLRGGLTDLPSRLLVVGGEPFDLDLLALLELRAPACAVYNHYGPTETTVGVTMRRVATVPGTADRLRAAGHRTVPVGTALGTTELRVVDERGNLCPPGRVGELVIGGPGVAQGYLGNDDETGRRFAGRVFRSGDRAVVSGGELELLGRADRQLKVRGHRVEAAGVEAALRTHPGVHDAAVALRELGDLGRALVAWVHGDVTEPELREHLRTRLPEPMTPSRIVVVPRLPRTSNGKVDHRALPDPKALPTGDADAVTRVFAEVLGLPASAVHDDFFRLGGHSLAALRVIDRLRAELGLDVAVADFYADPRPAAVSRAAVPATPGQFVPGVSPQVRALWTHLQLNPHDRAYEIPLRLRVSGPGERVRAALTEIATRHEALRTRYVHEDGELVAVVDPTPRATLTFSGTALDVETGPLIRARVTDGLVDLVVHHIAFDGVSSAVIARELVALLRGEELEPAPVAPPPPAPRPAVPLGEGALARFGLPSGQIGATAGCRDQRLPADLWPAVESRATALGTTPFAVVAAAWALVLSRQDGEQAVTIGTPADLRGEAQLVGYHVNVVVLEVEIEQAATVRNLVASTHLAVGRALAGRTTPYADLVARQREATGTPPTRTLLTVERLDHVEPTAAARPMLGVDVCVLVAEDDVRLQIHYRAEECPQWRADCLADQLVHVLRQLEPDRPVAELDLLPAHWVDRVRDWSHGPAAKEPGRWGVHGFLYRAKKNPEKRALVWSSGQWTRARLAEEIERTAHDLRERGLGPGHVVAVSAPPSPALVVAWHAAHLVGAAVLALDPVWPRQRRDAAAKHARAEVRVSTDDGLTLRIGGTAAHADHPEELAYLVSTSGSTGTPKTVAIQRSALANELAWFAAEFPLDEDDRVLAHTSPGFDVSVWEVLGPLAWGACLVFPDQRTDVSDLARLMAEVTVVQTVPSLLHAVLDHADLSGVRLILCGGEEMPVSLTKAMTERWPGTTLVNVYGPSETTIDATFWRVDRDALTGGRVPIGRPIAGTSAHVLDDRLRPVPPGVFGELAIGGNAVGLGYLNDPAETARRFTTEPRRYLTGDRARWTGAGELEFGGRRDNQVKIRGNRVELEEVEAVLRALPVVEDAVVHPIDAGTPNARLVALVVPASPLEVRDLHTAVTRVLPPYLVPSAFGLVDSLPLRPNGKVDRSALPLDAVQAPAPRTGWESAMQEKVGRAWADVLGHHALDPDLPFFASGGTSLQIPALRRRLGDALTVPELFEHATIRAQATALELRAAGADARTTVSSRGAARRQAIAHRRRGNTA